MEVWLASMSPDTLWEEATYGEVRDRATWAEGEEVWNLVSGNAS